MDFERLIVRVCMFSRKNLVLNLKIPAWAVLKFWGFSSLSVLRQSVLRDPTLLYMYYTTILSYLESRIETFEAHPKVASNPGPHHFDPSARPS